MRLTQYRNQFSLPRSLEERFNDSYLPEPTSGCWLWIGNLDTDGYGTMGIQNLKKTFKAHRISYKIHYGEFNEKLCVLHRCDNPPCVNPDHLFLGTHKDNMADMIFKKRKVIVKGENHGNSIVTNLIVFQIRNENNEISNKKIAEKYNLKRSHVWKIRNNVSWKHLIKDSK